MILLRRDFNGDFGSIAFSCYLFSRKYASRSLHCFSSANEVSPQSLFEALPEARDSLPKPPVLEYHKSGNDCPSSGIISLLCADSFEGSWILPFLARITVSYTGTLFDVYNLGLIVDFYNLGYIILI
jgi:hypothetical protein